ncbi:hypothetical protein CDL15_Pgr028455 [Punica granatum]|uniref:Uncharacterized protein n=1 Tax=Punica granatum TaxID=22663 RepID=A0A218VWZ1_PUNGR|nr:hypothetical protein CDL15_Pgr028455 [Punica granatum]
MVIVVVIRIVESGGVYDSDSMGRVEKGKIACESSRESQNRADSAIPEEEREKSGKKRCWVQDQWAGLRPDSGLPFSGGPVSGLGFARVWVESGIAESARFASDSRLD